MTLIGDHSSSFFDWKRERGLEPSFPFFEVDLGQTIEKEFDWLIIQVQVSTSNRQEELNLAKKVTSAVRARTKLVTVFLETTYCQVFCELISLFYPRLGVLILADETEGVDTSFFAQHYLPHLKCQVEFGPSTRSMLMFPSKKLDLWKTIQDKVMHKTPLT